MVLASQTIQDALEKVQSAVNRQLERQYRQLVDGLHDFLDDLFNHPLQRPWPMTLARFAAHWDARGLRLTSPTMASLERLIQDRLGPADSEQFAQGPAAFPDLMPLNTDAVSPYASIPAASRDTQKEFDGSITFFAKWQAKRVQTMFGLSDDERVRLEFYYSDMSRRMQEGRPLLPEPLFLYEARLRHLQGPAVQAITKEQMDESVRQEEMERYWELSPEARAELDRKWEREAREKYVSEYGATAAFFNPAFSGGFDDLVAVMGGFAGAGMPNPGRQKSFAQTARNRRGPRGKIKPPTVAPKKPKKRKKREKEDDGSGEKKREHKPEFPPPVDTQRYPIRPDGTSARNLQLAAESEEAMAHFLHSRPNIVVIYWGQKQGTHGADIITFNLRTKQVTLWDVKYRTAAVRLQPSKTFRRGTPARGNAIRQAMKAFETSSLSNANKAHAIRALRAGKVQTITVRAGNAKNSTIGD